MYVEHSIFTLPDKETKIWRYMDFTKFMSLLDMKTMFFTRADKFSDKFEGTYPIANKVMRPEVYRDLGEEVVYDIGKQLEAFSKEQRKFILVNCWHMNDYESAAMWDLYLKSNEGVAIQSNVGRLIDSFNDAKEEIYIGKVRYIDFKTDWMPEANAMHPFIHKRKSFEHEHELRAIHNITPSINDKDGALNNSKSLVEFGMPIQCDIKTLIENVYISPTAPEWFKVLVTSMCSKFDLNVDVIKSELSEMPY